MKLQQIGKGLAMLGIVSTLALSSGQAARAQDATRVYEVTITNLTTGQLLSPPVLATHGSDYALFEVGEKASEGIWTVAEQGNPTKLAEQLRATPEIASVTVADGLVHRIGGPGESTISMRIESHGAD